MTEELKKPQSLLEKSDQLKKLADELLPLDLKIKELTRSLHKFDGTDAIVNKEMPGYVSTTNADDVLNAMTPLVEVGELTTKAQNIIEQMLVIDPSVRLPCFDEYGY